jgi:hypothetical protein
MATNNTVSDLYNNQDFHWLKPYQIDKNYENDTRKRSVIRPAKPLVVKSQYPYGNFVASEESLSQRMFHFMKPRLSLPRSL